MKAEIILFEHTSYLSQVGKLRELAAEFVKQYPIKTRSIQFIKYGANAIFKVMDSRNKKYMLRINPPGFHSKNAILEEFKWLNHILKTTDIAVPKPVLTIHGEYIVEDKSEISAPRYCALFEWIDGRFLWKSIDRKYAYHVGALIAKLQVSGKQVKTKHREYWKTEGMVGTKTVRFANVDCLTGVSSRQQEIITQARRCAFKKLKHFENTHPEKIGLIHEDLNPNNIILCKGHYGIIDFDDCGVGLQGYDLTAPLFAFEYLCEGEKTKDFDELKEALYQGYSDHQLLTQDDIEMIPYFMLAKKLCAVGSVELRKDNPKMRPWILRGAERAIAFYKSIEKN